MFQKGSGPSKRPDDAPSRIAPARAGGDRGAEDDRRIQGVAWSWLRMLIEQAIAVGEENPERRQKLSNRTAADDQPLMTASRVGGSRGEFRRIAIDGETLMTAVRRRRLLNERHR